MCRHHWHVASLSSSAHCVRLLMLLSTCISQDSLEHTRSTSCTFHVVFHFGGTCFHLHIAHQGEPSLLRQVSSKSTSAPPIICKPSVPARQHCHCHCCSLRPRRSTSQLRLPEIAGLQAPIVRPSIMGELASRMRQAVHDWSSLIALTTSATAVSSDFPSAFFFSTSFQNPELRPPWICTPNTQACLKWVMRQVCGRRCTGCAPAPPRSYASGREHHAETVGRHVHTTGKQLLLDCSHIFACNLGGLIHSRAHVSEGTEHALGAVRFSLPPHALACRVIIVRAPVLANAAADAPTMLAHSTWMVTVASVGNA